MSAPPTPLFCPPMQLQLLPISLSPLPHLSLSVFSSPHCGSVNCSYSNIPSLPSPQLSFSQPLSCSIINLLVLSTCKSQTIVPYGAVWGKLLFILQVHLAAESFRSPYEFRSPTLLSGRVSQKVKHARSSTSRFHSDLQLRHCPPQYGRPMCDILALLRKKRNRSKNNFFFFVNLQVLFSLTKKSQSSFKIKCNILDAIIQPSIM